MQVKEKEKKSQMKKNGDKLKQEENVKRKKVGLKVKEKQVGKMKETFIGKKKGEKN